MGRSSEQAPGQGGVVALGGQPLLVVCDYDGTLAPIAPRPELAFPEPGAREALAGLLAHGRHRVSILTGRRVAEVQAFLALPDLQTIGLHGLEWPGEPMPPPDRAALERLAQRLGGLDGVRLEDKTWTLAAHYRGAESERLEGIETRLETLALPPGWERIAGKMVREFRPQGYGKGRALRRLVAQNPSHHPVFIGDDVTDEEGFAVLAELGGVGVKVGDGPTSAPHRLADPRQVVQLLSAWVAS